MTAITISRNKNLREKMITSISKRKIFIRKVDLRGRAFYRNRLKPAIKCDAFSRKWIF